MAQYSFCTPIHEDDSSFTQRICAILLTTARDYGLEHGLGVSDLSHKPTLATPATRLSTGKHSEARRKNLFPLCGAVGQLITGQE
jgi:hypothetical protein